jgi:acetyl esterase/lipase
VGGRVTRAVLAVAAVLPALIATPAATAQTDEPQRVLKREPYYLGLYEADGRRRGTVLMLHGGGWRGDQGTRADDIMREWIDRFVGWGFDVANLGYRSGLPGFADALDAFDLLREHAGPRERLCIFGGSAGAQLGLAAAAQRGKSVDCVVDLLGPPDLVDWGSQPGAAIGLQLARKAFGAGRLAELSPINMVDRIDASVLVGAAPCDIFIALSTQERFVDALNAAGGSARLQVIEPGADVPLGHCNVDEESFQQFLDVARPFVAGQPLPAEQARPGDDGSGLSVFVVIAVAVAGAGGLYWVLSRMKSSTA